MIHYIADVIEPIITALPYVERYGGLVVPMTHNFEEDPGKPKKTFPISPKVNYTECFNNGKYKMIAPDPQYKSIFWLEEVRPMTRVQTGDAGENKYSCLLKLVGFMNLSSLNLQDENKDFASPWVTMDLASKLRIRGQVIDDSILLAGRVSITVVGQQVRDKSIFAKWSFGEVADAALLYPFDCFALNIEGSMSFKSDCINPITLGTPIDKCLTIW